MAKRAYREVPVDEARRLATMYDKSMVVILAYDPLHGLTHTTTYGVAPEDKEQAADVGDLCARLICGEGFEQRRNYQDYRFADEGKRTQAIEELVKAAQAADHALGSLLAVRDGASDELLMGVRKQLTRALGLGNRSLEAKQAEKRSP